MALRPSIATVDKSLASLGTLASNSAKLSLDEKKEIRSLCAKAGKPSRQGLDLTDRARLVWLIRKAAPDKIPSVKVPPRLRKLLRLEPAAGDAPPLLRRGPATDPLDRLEKLGELREQVLTDEQFRAQRAKLLADPAIGSYLGSSEADPLDRLKKVAQLQEQGVITSDQALELTDKILDDT